MMIVRAVIRSVMTYAAKRIGALAGVVLLAGCADADLAQLEDTLADIRRSPGGQPPVVTVTLPENRRLAYLYSEERSPFLPPDEVVQGGHES